MKKHTLAALAAAILMMILALTACSGPAAGDDTSGIKVTYHPNYDGAEDTVVSVEGGERLLRPEAPARDGFIFTDWYTDAECTNVYVFGNRIDSSLELYAGWQEVYVFEIEYIDLDDYEGVGYSGGASGPDAIVKDSNGSGKASNGFFLSYAYKRGIELVFNINSDKDVSDATVYLRLSAEVTDITINSNTYKVQVNDTYLSYGDIVLDNVPAMSSDDLKPFEDYLIAQNVSLKAGENTIKLITDNDDPMGGTMTSTAPMIDCLKIVTEANLTWEPRTDNIENR